MRKIMSPLVILAILGLVAVFVLVAIFGAKQAKARREALSATRLAFSFDASDDGSLSARLGAFSPFSVGKDRRGYNSLRGSVAFDGKPYAIQAGDYRYTTESGTGKDRRVTTHRISYLACKLPLSLMTTMKVRPEGFFDKIAGAIGFDDIDFESAEFSRKFHVSGSDKKIIYDLLDPRMIEWYLTSDPPVLQIVADQLVLTRGGTWKPEEFEPKIEWLKEFVSRWPEHLVQRLLSNPTNSVNA
jgi:hypothetical protein